MNARENAIRTIRFDHPEYVMGGPPNYPIAYLGCHHEGFNGGGHHLPVGSVWTDIWGTQWHKEHPDVMGFPKGNPLDRPEKLRSFKWPDPDDERICSKIYEQAKDYPGGEPFLAGTHRDTLWEKTYMLVGMENAMEYFYTEPNFMREVLHRIMDFQLGISKHYLKIGVELVYTGDDQGTQGGPLLGPAILNDFLVPEYRRIFGLYKEKGVLIHFHSCGNVDWMIETVIDLGINILNPVQATANDLDKIRRISQGRLALLGAISTALVMSGPADKIRQAVRETIWRLGREGGYFCSPDQGMPFPKEHTQALDEARESCGRYPLSPPE
ncbi:MAG: hypothetical protein HZA50_08750 [Planctomycetes bacterium]|nr:hypothetical protein [Planctomycetota bacterium]